MTVFYAVYIDNLNDGSYDQFHSTHDKVSDAIRTANELENAEIFTIEA